MRAVARHLSAVSLLVFVTASVPHGLLAQETQAAAVAKRLSALDTLRVRAVSDPQLSPDGEWVLYTVAERDLDDEQLTRRTQLWRIRIDGTEGRQLTYGEESASSGRWFPDGDKIAFVRKKGDRQQVFAMYVDGGEAWPLTEHSENITSFGVSPDGKQLWFLAPDPESPEHKRRHKQHDDAVVVDQEFRDTHLWVFDLGSRESRRLTEGEFTVSDPQFSPDSRRIAYVTRPTPKVDDGWDSDIHVVDVASGESRLLYTNPGPDHAPRFSPDGATIAFTANPHPGTTVWYDRMYLMPADGSGDPEILLQDFDRNAGSPIWTPQGTDIYWSTGDRTRSNLFSVHLGTGKVHDHDAPRGFNSQFRLSSDGSQWVWVHSDPRRPAELYTAPAGELGAARRLTDHNGWLEAEGYELARVRVVRWNDSDGQQIEGVVHLPPDFQEGRRYPLIVNPHGGPSGAVMESFSTANQLLAANGFVVLQPNFRGSSNYGQQFLNANRNNWGIRDYDDIMTGVDAMIQRGWADPERMVAYGWSYGGYMTFWMSTQTDRFRLISPGAGLTDLYSMYSTTDIPGYMGWFFGTPWEHEEVYRRLSPIRYVNNVTAKMLILHGAADTRVPTHQAVEFYQALRDLGKDVTFVQYPRQGHGIREPRLQLDRLRRYVCAFADAVDMEPVTESCNGAVPARTGEDAATGQTDQDPGAASGALDPGTFQRGAA